MANSFVRKDLRARFILAASGAVFPGTNSNTLIVTGLRMSAQVQSSALQASQMSLKVWGMKHEDMDAITVAWAVSGIVRDHLVILEANSGDGWSKVFSGTIIEAQPQYVGAPDTYLSVQASVGYFQKIEGASADSYPGTVDIGVIVQDLANKMGFTFVNGGAKANLTNPALWGTLVDQLDQACRMAGCDYYLTGNEATPTSGVPQPGAVTPENARGTLTITPRGEPIAGAPVAAFLTLETGMIGYPVYGRNGLEVQALYQPAFSCGVPIEIESVVPAATGRWYPYNMVHLLDSNLPNGRWQTNMSCTNRGLANGG